MHRFIDGEDRMQQALLPHSLEDYVSEENPVRVIEVFIDELDLAALGFSRMTPAATGRPAYHPSTLLKIYLYGYLNRLQSSRRLEREAQRNIELMWLVGRLAPDFKTIADFRRDNGAAIRAVCRQFVELCRQLGLFTRAVVAIDGSKFKAVNNRDKNYTVAKVTGRMEQVDASIARYLRALDRADREESDVAEAKSVRLREKIAGLRRQMQALKAMEQTVQEAPDQQVSLTDPDARSMATSGKGTATVGYNVQVAVDAEHYLIVAHEVTNQGYDRHQLAPMALKAQQATGCEQITALADRGYFDGDQVLSCEGTGVAPVVPKTLTSGNTKRGLFTGQDFIYDAEKDHYTCPAGQHLTRGRARSDRSGDIDHYRHLSACFTCPLKPRCTAEKVKRVKRWVARVDELMRGRDAINQQALQLAVKETGVSKAWILGMLKENVERAMGTKPVLDKDGAPTGYYEWNGHVANKGLELLGREIGMFVERHELTLAQKLADMPEDQRATEMFELVERAKVRLAAIRAVERQTIEGSATEVSASDVEDDEPPKE